MKWMCASVVTVVTGLCSVALSQSMPLVEPGSALIQSVQFDRDYDADRGDQNRYQDRDQNAYPDQDRQDDYRDQGDNNDRDAADRNQDDSRQGADDYNRGYEAGYRAGQASVRAITAPRFGSAAPRIDRARFERCSRRYRSFEPASGTYVGFDGRRHVCL